MFPLAASIRLLVPPRLRGKLETAGVEPAPPRCKRGVPSCHVRQRGGEAEAPPRHAVRLCRAGRVRIRAARIRSAIALSIHVPQRRGVDAAGGPTPIGFPRRVLCLARLESRAMFSKPLAYPSTLDRRSTGCSTRGRCPTWRGFGARVSCSTRKKHRQKHTHISRRYSTLRAGGVFLPQAGPRFGPMSSSSWTSPRGRIDWAPFNDERRPEWVALDWLGMRLES